MLPIRRALTGLGLLLGLAALGSSPANDLGSAVEAIQPALLKAHVQFLSHDLLRGRDTGDVGFEVAREYVAAQFLRVGLEPWDGSSFLQPFDLLEVGPDKGSELNVGSLSVREPQARFEPSWLSGSDEWEGPGVYVGYGLATAGRNDYAGVDVSGKAIFLLAGSPPSWSEDRDRAREAGAKVELALRRGAARVIELVAPSGERPSAPAESEGPRRSLVLADGTSSRLRAHALVRAEASARLLAGWGIDPAKAKALADAATGKATSAGTVRLARSHEIKRLRSWNVVGIRRGTDPARAAESIVFSAHLDHVGIGPPDERGDVINNGAHDNAIGSAKLLAAAEAMARLRPRRSIVFAAVGAEERGLLGSWYYVRNAALPIEKAVANINLDGGREGPATEDVIPNGADFSDLERIVEEVMTKRGVQVTLVDRAARSPAGFSSDHYSFLLAGVPAVDFKDGYTVNGDPEKGLGERLYYYRNIRHRPADNFDPRTFTMESGAEMARRAVWLAWHLAEMEGRPEIERDHPMWRMRGRPEQPFYFGVEGRLP